MAERLGQGADRSRLDHSKRSIQRQTVLCQNNGGYLHLRHKNCLSNCRKWTTNDAKTSDVVTICESSKCPVDIRELMDVPIQFVDVLNQEKPRGEAFPGTALVLGYSVTSICLVIFMTRMPTWLPSIKVTSSLLPADISTDLMLSFTELSSGVDEMIVTPSAMCARVT